MESGLESFSLILMSQIFEKFDDSTYKVWLYGWVYGQFGGYDEVPFSANDII